MITVPVAPSVTLTLTVDFSPALPAVTVTLTSEVSLSTVNESVAYANPWSLSPE